MIRATYITQAISVLGLLIAVPALVVAAVYGEIPLIALHLITGSGFIISFCSAGTIRADLRMRRNQ